MQICLFVTAASLLEKEQLLFGAGIHSDVKDDTDAGRVSRDALSRASHNLMLQELEGLKKVYCQVCETHPFGSAKAVSDLIVLHEQTCFEATENRQLVKNLRQKNASLNAEVDALKVRFYCCLSPSSLDAALLASLLTAAWTREVIFDKFVLSVHTGLH